MEPYENGPGGRDTPDLSWQSNATEYHMSLIRCRGYNLFCFVQLLFKGKGGIYFFGKPGDSNDGWIRYNVHTNETVTVARRCQ